MSQKGMHTHRGTVTHTHTHIHATPSTNTVTGRRSSKQKKIKNKKKAKKKNKGKRKGMANPKLTPKAANPLSHIGFPYRTAYLGFSYGVSLYPIPPGCGRLLFLPPHPIGHLFPFAFSLYHWTHQH